MYRHWFTGNFTGYAGWRDDKGANGRLSPRNRLSETLIQLPAPAAKRADVADGGHRHLDQLRRIGERLRFCLGLDDAVINFLRRLLAGKRVRMRGILAADPAKAEIEEHPLQVRPIR